MRQRDDTFRYIENSACRQFILDAAPNGCKAHEGRRGLRKATLCGQRAFRSIIDFSRIRLIDLVCDHAEYLLDTNYLHSFAGMDVGGKLADGQHSNSSLYTRAQALS